MSFGVARSFLTVAMTMSGWAKHDKQPWTFGEPYTSPLATIVNGF